MLELSRVMTEAFPSPAEHPLPSVTTPGGKPSPSGLGPEGPLLAEVVRPRSDSYVGRISLVRVFSARCARTPPCTYRAAPRASGHEDHDDGRADRRADPPWASEHGPVTQARPRHLRCGQAQHAETRRHPVGQGQPAAMESWSMPEPLLPVAIVAKSKADEDKSCPGPEPVDRQGPDAAPGE